MSRRRAVCGAVTVAGAPCRNGPGCTLTHQTVPGGPVVAMTAAAGAGPDPFAAAPPPGAGAACFGDVLDQLTVEAGGDPQYRGKLFELVAIQWLTQVDPATPLGTFTDPARSGPPPTIGDIADVYSWKEFAANAKYRHMAPSGARDIGIDAVAKMKDGSLAAIQIKDGANKLTKNDLSKFIAQGSVNPGGVPRYAYQVLIYTNFGLYPEAFHLLQGHHGGLVIDRPSFAAAEPDGGWQALLDGTKAQRSKVTCTTRTKGADVTPTPPEETDGGTPPEPLTWEQTISQPDGRTRPSELDDAAWLRDKYQNQRIEAADIADELGRSSQTVRKALRKHGIPNRRARPSKLDDAAWLRDEYQTRGLSVANVAGAAGCEMWMVEEALREHGIPLRSAVRGL